MKKIIIISLAVSLLSSLAFVSVSTTLADKPAKVDRSVNIDGATPENPVVYLGKGIDKKTGQEIEGYAIAHFAKNSAKSKPGGTVCYGFLADGAKWKVSKPWIVDGINNGGLTSSFVLDNMTKDIAKWEDAADGVVGSGLGIDILGIGSLSSYAITPNKYSNGKNEVTFAPINSNGVIAVTYIWGVFRGLTSQRQLTEWDQIYSTNFNWSSTGDLTKMDFENIATHELGHAVGMDDLYNTSCSDQTMYGYANVGQFNKQTLESGDIAGISLLY